MQAVTIQRRIESLPTLSRSGKRVNGLHRLMRSPHLFEWAYEKVSRNKGALTPGIDGKTFDGMSLKKLADIAKRVADGTYRFRPVRRVYIPKDNGKTRPLGIPTVEDRLVQEAVRILLEAIYEPVFLDAITRVPLGKILPYRTQVHQEDLDGLQVAGRSGCAWVLRQHRP